MINSLGLGSLFSSDNSADSFAHTQTPAFLLVLTQLDYFFSGARFLWTSLTLLLVLTVYAFF